MSNFQFSVELKETNVKLTELSVKDLRHILKSLLIFESSPKDFIDNIYNLLTKKTNLSRDSIEKLNFIDTISLLIYLKCISSSSTVMLSTNISDKQTTIRADLFKFVEVLQNIDHSILNKTDTVKNVEISYRLPTLEDLICMTRSELPSCIIREVYVTDKKRISFSDITLDQRIKTFNTLPIKSTFYVRERLNRLDDILTSVNLLSHIGISESIKLPFGSNAQDILFLLKIIFNENLAIMYENIFMLSKYSNISADYIDSCTPGEYDIYIKNLEKAFAKENAAKTQKNENIFTETPFPENF